MIPISQDVLLEELAVAERIVAKWKTRVSEGIPGVDVPGTDEALEEFVRLFAGELMVLAGKCETLAGVLVDGGR